MKRGSTNVVGIGEKNETVHLCGHWKWLGGDLCSVFWPSADGIWGGRKRWGVLEKQSSTKNRARAEVCVTAVPCHGFAQGGKDWMSAIPLSVQINRQNSMKNGDHISVIKRGV